MIQGQRGMTNMTDQKKTGTMKGIDILGEEVETEKTVKGSLGKEVIREEEIKIEEMTQKNQRRIENIEIVMRKKNQVVFIHLVRAVTLLINTRKMTFKSQKDISCI